jgi:xanthine dehydrogenase small subunit
VIRPADSKSVLHDSIIVSGGTDLLVKRASELSEKEILSLSEKTELKSIISSGEKFSVGSSVTASEIGNSELLNRTIPGIKSFLNLVASEQVRNTGTLAGNIVNASPAADLTIIFLALRSDLSIVGNEGKLRSVPLNEFYRGYKKTDLSNEEFIRNISFKEPDRHTLFNFEKVSRRANLDIASVNSAISITVEEEFIKQCAISAGGVAPVPLLLERTSAFLEGKKLSSEIILAAVLILQEEISPINDIRGSVAYKRLLMRQLFFAHFLKLFPGIMDISGIR